MAKLEHETKVGVAREIEELEKVRVEKARNLQQTARQLHQLQPTKMGEEILVSAEEEAGRGVPPGTRGLVETAVLMFCAKEETKRARVSLTK